MFERTIKIKVGYTRRKEINILIKMNAKFDINKSRRERRGVGGGWLYPKRSVLFEKE